jgi:hypothetical protein
VYSQFKRALARRNLLLAWTLAAELPQVPLADALSLLLLALDSLDMLLAEIPEFDASEIGLR